MAGVTISDTNTTTTEVAEAPNRPIPAAKPAAAVDTDLLTAAKGAPIRVFTLRVAVSAAGSDTYRVHRIAGAGAASAANALAYDVPVVQGEVNFHDDIILAPGDRLVVRSQGGNVTFSGEYAEVV
jgi:hypothetical protein